MKTGGWRLWVGCSNDREMGRYTRPVSGKWLGKHVPCDKGKRLAYENKRCCLRSPCRGVIKKVTGATKSVNNLQSVLYVT
jgi:hypothetical protein